MITLFQLTSLYAYCAAANWGLQRSTLFWLKAERFVRLVKQQMAAVLRSVVYNWPTKQQLASGAVSDPALSYCSCHCCYSLPLVSCVCSILEPELTIRRRPLVEQRLVRPNNLSHMLISSHHHRQAVGPFEARQLDFCNSITTEAERARRAVSWGWLNCVSLILSMVSTWDRQ